MPTQKFRTIRTHDLYRNKLEEILKASIQFPTFRMLSSDGFVTNFDLLRYGAFLFLVLHDGMHTDRNNAKDYSTEWQSSLQLFMKS